MSEVLSGLPRFVLMLAMSCFLVAPSVSRRLSVSWAMCVGLSLESVAVVCMLGGVLVVRKCTLFMERIPWEPRW